MFSITNLTNFSSAINDADLANYSWALEDLKCLIDTVQRLAYLKLYEVKIRPNHTHSSEKCEKNQKLLKTVKPEFFRLS